MNSHTKRIATGIDVGTHSTRVVIVSHARGEAPQIIGTGVSETRGLRHGYIVDKADAMRSISAALSAAEKMAGFKIKTAILSVGGISLESVVSHGSTIISRASSNVHDMDLRKAQSDAEENLSHLTNKHIVHRTPIRYKLDNKEVLGDPVGMTGTKLEVKMIFITSLEQHLSDIIRTIEELGVEVDEVVPSPIAAAHVALNKKQRSVGCALVNIGAETVSIVVFENEVPLSLQIFPIGSTDITNDIALGLKISLHEAEMLKLGKPDGSYSKKKLEEIIEARLYDIFDLIDAHLKKNGRSGLLPGGVILTGGGAGIATIGDLAKAVLRLPSSVALPVIANAGKYPVKDSSWLVAYGLAVYVLQKPEEARHTDFSNIIETLKKWVGPFLP